MTDQELHRQAMAYALKHRVTYEVALRAMAEMTDVERTVHQRDATQQLDQDLHARAVAHSLRHQVPYDQALQDLALEPAGQLAEFGESAAALQERVIEIFRTGNHRDEAGVLRSFDRATLLATAGAYDPSLSRAPLVIGHPGNDRPVYGWVRGLEVSHDGRLLMRCENVRAEFAELVRAGRFKKRSASFYTPSDPGNPVPGVWYLRHVGWLGAQPPAVKGLVDVDFGRAGAHRGQATAEGLFTG